MVERDVDSMVEAIRNWELSAGEGFTDYFMDSWPDAPWAYWLLGKGYSEWANNIISENEKGNYVDQGFKFYFYDDYDPITGDWSEGQYRKNVRVWAEFLVESNHYFRRVTKFFNEHSKEQGDEL